MTDTFKTLLPCTSCNGAGCKHDKGRGEVVHGGDIYACDHCEGSGQTEQVVELPIQVRRELTRLRLVLATTVGEYIGALEAIACLSPNDFTDEYRAQLQGIARRLRDKQEGGSDAA